MGRYSWTQTLGEAVVDVPVPPGTKGKMCDVSITAKRLRVGLKGQEPILDGELFDAVSASGTGCGRDKINTVMIDPRHLLLHLHELSTAH